MDILLHLYRTSVSLCLWILFCGLPHYWTHRYHLRLFSSCSDTLWTSQSYTNMDWNTHILSTTWNITQYRNIFWLNDWWSQRSHTLSHISILSMLSIIVRSTSTMEILPRQTRNTTSLSRNGLFNNRPNSRNGTPLLIKICLIMKHSMSVDLACSICIFIIGTILNFFLNRYSYLVILLGGLLAYLRYISVVCYRDGTYCPFPFNFWSHLYLSHSMIGYYSLGHYESCLIKIIGKYN